MRLLRGRSPVTGTVSVSLSRGEKTDSRCMDAGVPLPFQWPVCLPPYRYPPSSHPAVRLVGAFPSAKVTRRRANSQSRHSTRCSPSTRRFCQRTSETLREVAGRPPSLPPPKTNHREEITFQRHRWQYCICIGTSTHIYAYTYYTY